MPYYFGDLKIERGPSLENCPADVPLACGAPSLERFEYLIPYFDLRKAFVLVSLEVQRGEGVGWGFSPQHLSAQRQAPAGTQAPAKGSIDGHMFEFVLRPHTLSPESNMKPKNPCGELLGLLWARSMYPYTLYCRSYVPTWGQLEA